MKNFILILSKGAINQNTLVNGKKIITEYELCRLMKSDFCNVNSCKSFTEWAEQLNATGEYEGKFTKDDALDSMSSMFELNIDGKHVSIYAFFKQHYILAKAA